MAVANVAAAAVTVSPATHWTPRSVRHNGIICVCVCVVGGKWKLAAAVVLLIR